MFQWRETVKQLFLFCWKVNALNCVIYHSEILNVKNSLMLGKKIPLTFSFIENNEVFVT